MSTTIDGVRIVDMPDLGTFTSTSSLVGEHAGSGRFSATGLSGFFLPITGGTVTPGPLVVDSPATELSTTIATNWTTCYPVANSPWPANPASPGQPAVTAQMIVQAETSGGATASEWTAVFGNYIATGHPNGQKVTLYAGAVQGPNAGAGWSLNTDIVRNATPAGAPGGPGGIGSGLIGVPGACLAEATIGYELDFSNWDQDCSPGVGPFTVGMFINAASTYCSLAAVYVGGYAQRVGGYLWDTGIFFQDSQGTSGYTIKDSTIADYTHSAYSYQDRGTHSGASHYLNDTSPNGLQISGNHNDSDIWVTDNAPHVLQVSGTHASVVNYFSATITGLAWNGPFSAVSVDSTPIGATTPAAGRFTIITGTNSGGGAAAAVAVNSATGNASFAWIDGSGAADTKKYDALANGGQIFFRVLNDSESSAVSWLTMTRSGVTPQQLNLIATSIELHGRVGFNSAPALTKPTVTGSRGGNAALGSLIAWLASYGLITDGTTA